MTDEERTIITSFIQRVSGANRLSGGSVPGTVQALPPVDPAADALIADLFGQYPEARYRLTQTAFVQEHALSEAQNRIAQLQAQLQQAQAQQSAQSAPSGGGFFHNLFGGGQAQQPPQQPYQPYPQQPQYAPPPQYAPQYAPGYQPGMFQRSGSGFLGSALTTAAGVAGGMIAGNALMNLFEGNRGFGGGGGFGGGYEPGPFGGGGFEQGGGPWDAPPPDAQVTGSAWDNQTESSDPAGWGDQGGSGDTGGGWDQGGAPDTDLSGGDDSGGGWDNSN